MADDFNFNNPYSAPQTSGQIPPIQEGSGLKSLGQEVRKSSLNKARWIMIIIGVIQIAYSTWELTNLETALRGEFRRLNVQVNAQQLAQIKAEVMPYVVAFLGAGIVFVLLGIFVHQFPVPFTIAGLVLYVGIQLVMAVLNPATLANGWLVKILFIAGLWSAIQAAIAYEKERRMAPFQQF